ncbi:hypothetical protein [Streptomyces halobius]|uniref:Uncharacterized protein n=1 Tax=Streptomyces halobius TaxID=2879846 RepID=A0ABY4M7K6_9ACTN|nr:hypothetical protein [Streptomyces halobius]UQA93732.1 hypothetical protein K9S39_19340 [Streptomyces halobius]
MEFMTLQGAQKVISGDIRAAIKAATPDVVYPEDEFGTPTEHGGGRLQFDVRVVGWDPDESQSNDSLLKKSTAYLVRHGWRFSPEVTDSEDRSALISKTGLAEGRLYASNQSLTFTGHGQCVPG